MLIENVRLSFPRIFRAEVVTYPDGTTKKHFSCMIIIRKDDPQVQAIKKEMVAAAEAKWPGKGVDMFKQLQAGGRIALRDGAEKADIDGLGDDFYFFNASSTRRPGIFDRDGSALVEDDGKPYAGCYVNVIVYPWAQNNPGDRGGKRINMELAGVQFYADGEAFGGGGSVATADDFKKYDDPAPSGDTDDDDDDFL